MNTRQSLRHAHVPLWRALAFCRAYGFPEKFTKLRGVKLSPVARTEQCA
jgi:hypothetical protein